MGGGAHLQIFQVLTGHVQGQLKRPNVADRSTRSRDGSRCLGQVVAHFLHVVHQQHLSSAADAAVVFQEHTLLVQRLQQGSSARGPTSVPPRPVCRTRAFSFWQHLELDTEISSRPWGAQFVRWPRRCRPAGWATSPAILRLALAPTFQTTSPPTSWHVTASSSHGCAPWAKAVNDITPMPTPNPCAQARRVRNHVVQFGLKIQRVLRGTGAVQGAQTTVSVTPEYAANHPKPPSTVVEADVGSANGLPWFATLFSKSRRTSKTS